MEQQQWTGKSIRPTEHWGIDESIQQYEILCPVCGYDYVHLESEQAAGGKSLDIMLHMKCEVEQHRFCLRVKFHKGNAFLFIEKES